MSYRPHPVLIVAAALFAGQIGAAEPAPIAVKPKVFEGVWRVRSESFATPHSKEESQLVTLAIDCEERGGAYACRQRALGAREAATVFRYDPERRRFAGLPLVTAPAGPSSGALVIIGSTWIYPWQETEDGRTTHYRLVHWFQGPYDIAFRTEYSTDLENWTRMSTGHGTRLAG
jgi:hypothetical protein